MVHFSAGWEKDSDKKIKKVATIKDFNNLEIGDKVDFSNNYARGIYAGKVPIKIFKEEESYYPLLLSNRNGGTIYGTLLEPKDYIYLHSYKVSIHSAPKKFKIYNNLLKVNK